MKADAETRALVLLGLKVAAEAAEVCDLFVPGFEPVAALRAAEAAFGRAYGLWYENGGDAA